MSLLVRLSTDPGALLVRDTDDPLALAVTESTSPLALRVRESTSPLAQRVRGLFSPSQLPGLAAWYDAADSSTVLTSVGPDVPATNGQTVRRWLSRHNPAVFFDQSTLANQPTFTNATTGLTFDGVNDFMDGTSTMAGVFRNKGYGYIFAVAQDTNRTGEPPGHPVFYFGLASGEGGRITFSTRSITNNFHAVGRRDDAESAKIVDGGVSNGNLNLFEYQARWAAGAYEIFSNGVSLGSGNYAASGSTSNTDSVKVAVGQDGGVTNLFPGNIRELIIGNAQLTDAQRLSVLRYLQRKWGTPALP
jgi:hypothetical protein